MSNRDVERQCAKILSETIILSGNEAFRYLIMRFESTNSSDSGGIDRESLDSLSGRPAELADTEH